VKILIVKTSSLGDLIHTFGALDYLRYRFPDAQIDWVVENPFSELLKSHPQIDRVITIESKKWRHSLTKRKTWGDIGAFRKKLREVEYDLLFDLQGNTKSGLIVGAARAKEKIGFGFTTLFEWPNALFTNRKIDPVQGKNVRDENLAIVQGYFQDSNPYVPRPISLKLDPLQQQKLSTLFPKEESPTLVCPFAAWQNKCLSEEGLIQWLRRLNHSPYWFIWGSPQEREVALRLSSHFAGSSVLERLPLPLLQHVMSRCRLVIAMDSLPLHLCGTTATPTLSFFGPSSALKYSPVGEHHRTIQGKCPYGIQFDRRCPKLRTCETGSCLKLASQLEGVATKPEARADL
jgi:heptosyltransferase-1